MVQIIDIVSLNESVDLGLDPGDVASFNGITAEWEGNAWRITNLTDEAPQGLRRGQSLPKKYKGGLTNAARAQKGLPRLDFDGGGNVRSSTTPSTTSNGTNDTDINTPPNSSRTVPEHDDLTPAEKRQLRQNGRVTIAGQTFTQVEIDNATRAGDIRRAQAGRDAAARLFDLGDGELEQQRQQLLRNKQLLQGPSAIRVLKGALPLGFSSVGVTVASWMALKENMLDLNAAIAEQPVAQQTKLRQDYQERVRTLIGLWLVANVLPDVFWTLKNSKRNAQIIFQGVKNLLRSANAVSMALQQSASLLTGPGFLLMAAKNLIQWLLLEAAMGIAIYFLMRNETLQVFVLNMAKNSIIKSIGDAGYVSAEALKQFVDARVDEWTGDGYDPDAEQRDLTQMIDDIMSGTDVIPGYEYPQADIDQPNIALDLDGNAAEVPSVRPLPNASAGETDVEILKPEDVF